MTQPPVRIAIAPERERSQMTSVGEIVDQAALAMDVTARLERGPGTAPPEVDIGIADPAQLGVTLPLLS